MLTDISIKVVLRIPFLAFSNIDIEFTKLEKLTLRSSITVKVLTTINRVKLIDKREFAKVALNKNLETFIMHISVLETTTIYLSRIAQITALEWNKPLTKILFKHFDYANIFSIDLVIELAENINMNKHAIKLIKGK